MRNSTGTGTDEVNAAISLCIFCRNLMLMINVGATKIENAFPIW